MKNIIIYTLILIILVNPLAYSVPAEDVKNTANRAFLSYLENPDRSILTPSQIKEFVDYASSIAEEQRNIILPPSINTMYQSVVTSEAGAVGGTEIVCGDNICEQGENQDNCPQDCREEQTIKVIYPNRGEVWSIGDTVEIKWSAPSSISKVDIDLLTLCPEGTICFSLHYSIAKEIPNDGAFEWIIKKDMNGNAIWPRDDYVIRVSNSVDGYVSDESDMPFSIISPRIPAPIPKDAHCFRLANKDKPECAPYYRNDELACPQYFNPVFSDDGIFYPTACWAEALGVSGYSYGYSPKLLDFFKEQWALEGLNVPHPNIEFTYQGSGLASGSGTWLRSVYWHDTQTYSTLDYVITDDFGNEQYFFKVKITHSTLLPVMNNHYRALLAFVLFDNVYSENVLLDLTPTYVEFLNDYIRKKQEVPNPLQYVFTPVVISPPAGVKPITQDHIYFSDSELRAIYNTAVQKADISDAKVFIVSPATIGGFGGYYSTWNGMQLIEAPLTPPAAYSTTNKRSGLDAIAAFQQMFLTISHEVLHAVGLSGDHMPMGYGTYFLDAVGQDVDPLTGKTRTEPSWCDFFGTSPDYYAVEIPNNLGINVGQEPSWLYKSESSSGPCLSNLYNNEWLKDYDRDGEYEIMYKNNLIGKELQRSLGWTDVDGDGIAELIDPTPYGSEPICNNNICEDIGNYEFTGVTKLDLSILKKHGVVERYRSDYTDGTTVVSVYVMRFDTSFDNYLQSIINDPTLFVTRKNAFNNNFYVWQNDRSSGIFWSSTDIMVSIVDDSTRSIESSPGITFGIPTVILKAYLGKHQSDVKYQSDIE